MKLSLAAITLASISSMVSANSILPEKNSCTENRYACTAGNSPFPTPSSLDTTLSIRGGEVLEPTTLSEVDDILMKASAEGKLVVIDFSATWCGPCRAIAPLYKELSEQYGNTVFLKVDVDENPETAAKYGVSAMPTFLFLKRGDVVDKMMGANPTKLQELLEELA
eukprot:scaffold3312_cov199-Chaetoceros_neogracile.AAC.3